MGSTLLQIRNNVRRNLGEATSNFYANTDLNYYISVAYKKYTNLMIQEGDGYFVETINLGFTQNDPNIDISALDPPFFSISRLERNTSTGTIPLKASKRRFTPNSTLFSGVGDSYLPTYWEKSKKIVLEPTPQGTEVPTSPTGTSQTGMRLDYNYEPDFPVATSPDSFTFDDNFLVVFEPLIELCATIAALESKDGMGGVSDIQSFRGRLASLEVDFMNSLERTEYPDSVQYMGQTYGNGGNYGRY